MAASTPSFSDLVGAWRLEEFVFTDATGDALRPLGEAPAGAVVVSPDGYLSLVFMRRDRSPFATPDIQGGTPAQKAAAYDGYISFGGPCRLDGDQVVVQVAHALFPDWVGSEQRRNVSLDGDILTLRTVGPLVLRGTERCGRAVLSRVG